QVVEELEDVGGSPFTGPAPQVAREPLPHRDAGLGHGNSRGQGRQDGQNRFHDPLPASWTAGRGMILTSRGKSVPLVNSSLKENRSGTLRLRPAEFVTVAGGRAGESFRQEPDSTRARTARRIAAGRSAHAATTFARSGSAGCASRAESRAMSAPEVAGVPGPSVAAAADCKSAIPGSNPGGASEVSDVLTLLDAFNRPGEPGRTFRCSSGSAGSGPPRDSGRPRRGPSRPRRPRPGRAGPGRRPPGRSPPP